MIDSLNATRPLLISLAVSLETRPFNNESKSSLAFVLASLYASIVSLDVSSTIFSLVSKLKLSLTELYSLIFSLVVASE